MHPKRPFIIFIGRVTLYGRYEWGIWVGPVTFATFSVTGDQYPARRHLGNANLVFLDGHVALVDADDLAAVRTNFGFSAAAKAVPEPATLGLLLLGGRPKLADTSARAEMLHRSRSCLIQRHLECLEGLIEWRPISLR